MPRTTDVLRRYTPSRKGYCIIFGNSSQAEFCSTLAVIFIQFFKEDDTMKIEKLPSGSYRARKTYKKVTYTVVFDHKPTQKEVMQAISAEMEKEPVKKTRLIFETAAMQYIDVKSNVLSPTTIAGYHKILRNISDDFKQKHMDDLMGIDIQKEINLYSVGRSPKTVRNTHGFISAVVGMFRPNMKISTTLPQKVKKEPYIPSDNDIKAILSHANGTKYEIPILLACYGLRRSEICALTLSDIDGNTIHINKAKVQNNDGDWIIKTTKTTQSTRDVILPQSIIQKILDQGYVYKGHPSNISDYLTRTQKELNIPHFSVHKLRHYFASKMSSMNIPEADIMKMGGWETDYVMKNVYRHVMKEHTQKLQEEASNKLASALLS